MTHRAAYSDVIVIGAGLAGLRAADLLVQQGYAVRVLEASERVGGRTLEHTLEDGTVLHWGATWCGANQPRIMALTESLGLETIDQNDEGAVSLHLDGRVYECTDPDGLLCVGPYPVPRSALSDAFMTALAELDRLSADLSRTAPQEHPRAQAWDAISAADWLAGLGLPPTDAKLLRGYLEAELWIELEALSFLFLLFNWITVTDWMQGERRIRGGSQQLSRRLSARLGDRVMLAQPVRAVRQAPDQVEVETDQAVYSGSFVIVTCHPGVCRNIRWSPALPTQRRALHDKLRLGKVIRLNLVYETPFWRDDGRAGLLLSIDGPIEGTADCTVAAEGPGILNAFVAGRHVDAWTKLSDDDRRDAVLRQLETVFGPRARLPRTYREHSWLDETGIEGGHCGVMPPGVLATSGAALRAPVGRIHWAGTETARIWYGWMEGALESAERAAGEVGDRLGQG